MDIIIVTIILQIIWLSPNILYSLEQRNVTKPEHSDTVLTVSKGAPYYDNGRFVGYIEV